MIKGTIFVVGGLMLTAALIFGGDTWDAACAFFGSARESARDTLESDEMKTEIDRRRVDAKFRDAKRTLTRIDQEIHQCRHLVAKEEIEVGRLAADVDTRDTKLKSLAKVVIARQADLEKGQSFYTYASHGRDQTYDVKRLRSDVKAKSNRFQSDKRRLDNLSQVLEARQLGLEAARDKLVTMESERGRMAVDIENLKARRKMVEVAEATSEFEIDSSELANLRKSLAELNTDLSVREKVADASVHSPTEIPTDEGADPVDVIAEIHNFLGTSSESVADLSHDK